MENQLERDRKSQTTSRALPVNPFISWPWSSQLFSESTGKCRENQMVLSSIFMDTVRNGIQIHIHPRTHTYIQHTDTESGGHPHYSPTAIHSYRLVLNRHQSSFFPEPELRTCRSTSLGRMQMESSWSGVVIGVGPFPPPDVVQEKERREWKVEGVEGNRERERGREAKWLQCRSRFIHGILIIKKSKSHWTGIGRGVKRLH